MEGKTVVLSVLIISLVMSQIQVEAIQACCPTTAARNAYITCRNQKTPKPTCASLTGCIIVPYGACPGGYVHDILKNSGDDVTEYCKLGCTSSVCIALTTLQNSDANEIVNGAVEKCTEACSTFCTKGSKQALEIAA